MENGAAKLAHGGNRRRTERYVLVFVFILTLAGYVVLLFEPLAHFGGSFCHKITLVYPIFLQRSFRQELTGLSRVVYFEICFEMCITLHYIKF